MPLVRVADTGPATPSADPRGAPTVSGSGVTCVTCRGPEVGLARKRKKAPVETGAFLWCAILGLNQ